jgi:arsenite methyltransferase
MSKTLAYDELPLWSAPFGLTLLDTIRTRKFMNILDIGSGSGFPMLEIAERFGLSCMVYGLDPSADAIAMINAKKEAKGIVNARILKGVAEEIPFPDKYFELVISNNGLNNVSDQKRSLSECFRVCDDGAQMVLTMNLPHTMVEFYDAYEQLLGELGLTEEISEMHAHITSKRTPVEELRVMIEATGFTIRTINVDGFKMKYTEGTAFFNSFLIKNYFMPSWQAFLPPDRITEVFILLEQKLNNIAKEQGELVMSVPFVCIDCVKT